MRSLLATLGLGLVALVTVGLATLRLSDGDLARVLGAPAAGIGDTLYRFDPGEVVEMQLLGNGVSAICKRGDDGWKMISPWKDRMDPRAVQALFAFTLGTRVESAIPEEKVESLNIPFQDGRIGVRMADRNDDPLAKFMIGHRTAWVATDPETGDTFPTVFLQPRDKSRKDYLYACTDRFDIHAVLGDGFKRLRDHRPFLFHPDAVESIRIRNRSGEMQLSRGRPGESFEIVKPLGLKSRRDAVKRLLQGLYDLQATEVLSRSAITLPGTATDATEQIALNFFGTDGETVLEIHPPAADADTTVLATVSDRSNAVFRLPRTPLSREPDGNGGRTSLADLPLSVNELRDPTLASITPQGLAAILISPATGEDIIIRRDGPNDRFSVMLDGRLHEPSDVALFSLVQAVNESEVMEFVSDSATDLAPYGLDTPFLILRFLGFDGTRLQLSFGQDDKGGVFAIREGTTTVVRLKPEILGLIPTRPWDWRPPLVWKISSVNVDSIVRRKRGEDELVLEILDPVTEEWRAKRGGDDVTSDLSKERADILLGNLLDLKARNWLPAGESGAAGPLSDPDLQFTLFVETFDDEGEKSGVEQRELRIATVERGKTRLCYGSVYGEPNPFLLDPETVDLLGVELIGGEE